MYVAVSRNWLTSIDEWPKLVQWYKEFAACSTSSPRLQCVIIIRLKVEDYSMQNCFSTEISGFQRARLFFNSLSRLIFNWMSRITACVIVVQLFRITVCKITVHLKKIQDYSIHVVVQMKVQITVCIVIVQLKVQDYSVHVTVKI